MVLPIRNENAFDGSAAADARSVVTWKHQLQRLVNAFVKTGSQQKTLRHVETLSLGAKRNVYLMECDGQRFLVADGLSTPVPLTQRYATEERR